LLAVVLGVHFSTGCRRAFEQVVPVGNLIEVEANPSIFTDTVKYKGVLHNSGSGGSLTFVVILYRGQKTYVAHRTYATYFSAGERRRVSFEWRDPPSHEGFVLYNTPSAFWDHMAKEDKEESILKALGHDQKSGS
jgi:hypothetical protein